MIFYLASILNPMGTHSQPRHDILYHIYLTRGILSGSFEAIRQIEFIGNAY